MNTKKIYLTLIFLLICNTRSESSVIQNKYIQTSGNFLDTNASIGVTIRDAVDYTAELLECVITKAELRFMKDIPLWKINGITSDRGTVELEISALDRSLLKIDAEEGPFEYEIKPHKDLVSFTEAKRKAEDFSGQKTLKWNLSRIKKRWEYHFWVFIKSGKAQVKIDAATGDIIKTGKKK